MTKTRRLLSMLLALVMLVSVLSGFSVTFAAGVADSAEKAAAELDKLAYSPFAPLTKSPGYGVTAPSGIIFVCTAWAEVAEGKTVYMDYSGEVYKAVRGDNAFGSISEALAATAANNLIIKCGPGTYQDADGIRLSNNGLQFLGNYAGVIPNVDTDKPYKKDLNPLRDPTLESVINATQWTWTTTSNNITLDGFTIKGQSNTCDFDIAVSGTYSEYFYMFNCIIEGVTQLLDANRGYSTGVYFKYNRVVNCGGTGSTNAILLAGGSMCDVMMDHNYFENNATQPCYYTSCGLSDSESLISFSYNVMNNCSRGPNFAYDNANFGANLDYKRIVGNVFYGGGAGSGSLIRAQYYMDCEKNESIIDCTNTASKTFIGNNDFYNISSTVHPIDLVGRESLLGKIGNYIITVTNNRFIYANPEATTCIKSTIYGTIDASHNFFGYHDGENIKPMTSGINYASNVAATSTIITMPNYLDFEMTKLGGGINMAANSKAVLKRLGITSMTVDNAETKVYVEVPGFGQNGYLESVPFRYKRNATNYNSAFTCDVDFSFDIYTDYMLTKKVNDDEKTVNLTGDSTRVYLVATDNTTGQAVKYDLIINSTVDKTKCDIRYLIDDATNLPFTNYTIDGEKIEVGLESKYKNFPFSLVVSPGASCTVYTDKELKNEYADETYYMAPDVEFNLYAKVVSGDKSASKVYNLVFKREGSEVYDARIIQAISPEADILIFNNERRTVVYRPKALITSAIFNFKVSENATYTIYKNYDENTGELSEAVSSMDDVKEVPIADGMNYYYVEVKSDFGFSRVYTIVTYNDVKSDDNIITGIDGLSEGLTITDDNVIYIEASSTLTAVNAHFSVDPFAVVDVFADEERTYALTPNKTYEIINNREVEVRSFQLGITNRVSYFYVNVTSETGKLNQYKIIITKDGSGNAFTDIEGHWAKDFIVGVADFGIITGYHNADNDTYYFSPNANANRQEMAVMICRMMGIDPLSFKNESLSEVFADADDIADWSYNYIKAVYHLGVMVGSDNDKGEREFKCKAKITRQEFFQAIANILELDIEAAASVDLAKFKDGKTVAKWAIPATKAVIKAGIVEGDSNGNLNPKANITRAEITKIIALTNIIHTELE